MKMQLSMITKKGRSSSTGSNRACGPCHLRGCMTEIPAILETLVERQIRSITYLGWAPLCEA